MVPSDGQTQKTLKTIRVTTLAVKNVRVEDKNVGFEINNALFSPSKRIQNARFACQNGRVESQNARIETPKVTTDSIRAYRSCSLHIGFAEVLINADTDFCLHRDIASLF